MSSRREAAAADAAGRPGCNGGGGGGKGLLRKAKIKREACEDEQP